MRHVYYVVCRSNSLISKVRQVFVERNMYSAVSTVDLGNATGGDLSPSSKVKDSTELLSLSVVTLDSTSAPTAPSPSAGAGASGTGGDNDTVVVVVGGKSKSQQDDQKRLQVPEQSSSRPSRWNKLRSTVQVASAATAAASRRNGVSAGRHHVHHHHRGSLNREDSFLKKFSTRYGGAPYAIAAAADRAAEAADRLDEANGGCRRRIGVSGAPTDVDGEAGQEVEEARRRRRRQRRFVVNPDENFAFYWLMVTSLAVLYNLWTCIARQAFPEIQQTCHACWITIDIIFDVVYVFDIVIQARTGYLERGLVVYDGRKLCRHYFFSWHFAVDALSLLPLDFIQLVVGVCPIIRAPRFLKSYRLLRFVHVFEMRTAYPNMWRVANLSHVLFLGSHWFAAFYYLISAAENFQSSWGYPYPVGNYSTVAQKYLRSLYWSTLTLTTIGDLQPPETNWE